MTLSMKLPSNAPIMTQKMEPTTQNIIKMERKPLLLPSIQFSKIIDFSFSCRTNLKKTSLSHVHFIVTLNLNFLSCGE